MKIALICSHGGHLTEMLYLMDAFKDHDVFFITYDNIRTRNLEYRKYLFPNLGEGRLSLVPFRLLKRLPSFIKILREEKPDLIVSNGAEIAIPFFWLSKFFRIKTVFIECYTRIDTPTITGKVVYPVSNLFLVLWPEMLEEYGKKAQYWGGIFDLVNSSTSKKEEGDYFLVITGMHSGFDRLIEKMDEIAGQIDEKVVIQIGKSQYVPKNAEYFHFKEYDEIKRFIKDAKAIICPGAMTLLDSLTIGTPVICVPRLEKFGEHLNNHQLTFARKLEENKLIRINNDVSTLEKQIFDYNKLRRECLNIDGKLINRLKNFING